MDSNNPAENGLRLTEILKKVGFQLFVSEPCVYVNNRNEQINIIAVYVDDLLTATSNSKQSHDIKAYLSREVEVIDKESAKHFLSMKVNRNSETGCISIGQKKHYEN